jgi:hypothetical protein
MKPMAESVHAYRMSHVDVASGRMRSSRTWMTRALDPAGPDRGAPAERPRAVGPPQR